MLRGDTGGVEHDLQLRDVEPEDSDAKGEGDGREETEVLRLLVEGGWVAKDRQAACSDGHEVEPLPVRYLLVLALLPV